MMHDFVDTHRDKAASTESFKVIAEKHMNKSMDLRVTAAWIGSSTNGSTAPRSRGTSSNTNCSRMAGN
jgi:hypothetical protein